MGTVARMGVDPDTPAAVRWDVLIDAPVKVIGHGQVIQFHMGQ